MPVPRCQWPSPRTSGRVPTFPRFENRIGAAMFSQSWQRARDGNEDAAAPVDVGDLKVALAVWGGEGNLPADGAINRIASGP
jgi:hypothetical protein